MVMCFIVLVLLSGTVFADFNAKIGMDFMGSMDLSYEGTGVNLDVNPSFTVAGEYSVPLDNDVELGTGVSLQAPRLSAEEGASDDDTYNFISLYGLAKYDLDQIYLLGQLGYSVFNTSDVSDTNLSTIGGLYYGMGAGMYISEQVFGELLYSVNNGGITDNIDTVDVKNSQLSLMVGVSF